jgi:hypothetical protein
MPEYVLANRRNDMFTNNAKIPSCPTVSATLGLLTSVRILSEQQPAVPSVRQVVLLDAGARQAAAIRASLSTDSSLEPAIRRSLLLHTPIELQPTIPDPVTARTCPVVLPARLTCLASVLSGSSQGAFESKSTRPRGPVTRGASRPKSKGTPSIPVHRSDSRTNSFFSNCVI